MELWQQSKACLPISVACLSSHLKDMAINVDGQQGLHWDVEFYPGQARCNCLVRPLKIVGLDRGNLEAGVGTTTVQHHWA